MILNWLSYIGVLLVFGSLGYIAWQLIMKFVAFFTHSQTHKGFKKIGIGLICLVIGFGLALTYKETKADIAEDKKQAKIESRKKASEKESSKKAKSISLVKTESKKRANSISESKSKAESISKAESAKKISKAKAHSESVAKAESAEKESKAKSESIALAKKAKQESKSKAKKKARSKKITAALSRIKKSHNVKHVKKQGNRLYVTTGSASFDSDFIPDSIKIIKLFNKTSFQYIVVRGVDDYVNSKGNVISMTARMIVFDNKSYNYKKLKQARYFYAESTEYLINPSDYDREKNGYKGTKNDFKKNHIEAHRFEKMPNSILLMDYSKELADI